MKDSLMVRALKVAPVAALAVAVGTMIANNTWSHLFVLADMIGDGKWGASGA